MKNIHVLPTDKPSRLFLNKVNSKLLLEDIANPNLKKVLPSGTYQHIYITSDEEIKEGDWFYLPRTNDVYKCNEEPTELNLERRFGVSKIILTTDQDLIKDGVQAIDNKFLEWFVKNPSCEKVEVIFSYKSVNELPISYYRIVIPKKEPKQETLEEAAERLWLDSTSNLTSKKSFIAGAKWQAERSYSDLSELRNDLYDKLPIGDVDAFEILKVIKNHLQKLDALCGNK